MCLPNDDSKVFFLKACFRMLGCSMQRKPRLQSRLGRFQLTSSPAITAHESLVQFPIPYSATISARASIISLSILQSVTITTDGSFSCPLSSAAYRKGSGATSSLGRNVASSARHKYHRFPLSCLSSPPRPLVNSLHRLHNRIFPPSVSSCTIR